eukprot:TRINITY_DN12452_c0_g1_i1.p1 TRINITY_DN12452_c0_g1~~TRINITY_DN12452_c0_g1_i1.p1  ORF type:complete len:292 (-),score=39.18 TRINITY_DN12452_c0_g1_i1:28-903(-)
MKSYSRDCLLFLCLVVIGSSYRTHLGATPYNESVAKEALYYSYAAYCTVPKLNSWNCYWCTKGFSLMNVTAIYDSGTNTQAFVGMRDKTIWISFRGTVVTSIVNWIDNSLFFPSTMNNAKPAIKVHSGFLNGYNALYPRVKGAVKSLLSGPCKGCSIFLTGHSLGGAIATITAVGLSFENLGVKISEISFGSPRTGNSDFYQYHQSVVSYSYRVTNKKDTVPRVPTHLLLGYHHVPTEVWYPPSGSPKYVVCNGSGEDPSCSLSINFATTDIPDHRTYLGINLELGKSNGC